MKNLSEIVRAATPHSLVLLDELGAGTDPQEGVALAMSLLDHFIATRLHRPGHHASRHTEELRRHAPGRPERIDGIRCRHAGPYLPHPHGRARVKAMPCEIARRSGMPANVLATRSAYLDDERTDISRLVSNLAERHQKLIQAEEEHKTLEHELSEKKRTTELKELALRQKELDLRRLGLKELRDFLVGCATEMGGDPPHGGQPAGRGLQPAGVRHPGPRGGRGAQDR